MANENPTQPRKCGYTVQQVADRDKSSSFKKEQDAPMRLRAVDRKVDGCPVLVMVDSDKTIEPPSFAGASAKKFPAH
ncbi:hypothetical protein JQK15_24175 [Sphingobium sp. BHU LFT2]|uniref:hypothetical protein n=1 Tax=Sphingobium sp. BHU LFT2 TaxID=2807634 RepID=UPI001BE95C08|nr:hypothetical protein [Sphingobium sp. BHU LFT2]MBT2246607.1 hypothetical protein [Sphingobium sp. BHU LFT2]